MKRFTIVLVAMGAFGLVFAGCKKKEEEKKTDTTEETAAKPVEGTAPAMEADKAEPAAEVPAAAEEAAQPAAAEGSIGVAECDDLVTKYTACVNEKAPADAREKTLADFNSSVETWKKDSADETKKAELAKGCTAQAESLKKSTEAWGCAW